MWRTHHMAVLAVVVTILSVTLTLYAQSKIKILISAKAAELNSSNSSTTGVNSNPIQLMSALSSKKIHPDNKSSIAPPPVVSQGFADEVDKTPKSPPKGSGSRWTPLK